jgi:6-phosphogluconolactonase
VIWDLGHLRSRTIEVSPPNPVSFDRFMATIDRAGRLFGYAHVGIHWAELPTLDLVFAGDSGKQMPLREGRVTVREVDETVLVVDRSFPGSMEVRNTMRTKTKRGLRFAVGAATLSALGLLGALGAGAAGAAPIGGHSPGNWSPVIGHVYLDDNTAGTNTISGFDRHLDGSLTPLAGSPFTAGGAGTGAGLASQGAIQVSPDGRYLLAVDAGSNQVSVLRIGFDGSLQLVPGGVVSSDGPTPVSIAVHNNLVYVANAGAVGPNYAGFTLNWFGQLQPLPDSTIPLPNGSQPGDVLFNATGTNLAGTRVGTSEIDSFVVGWNGLLTTAPGSPSPAQGLGPFGSEFRPTNPHQLFVSNAHNGAGLGTVSAFNVGFNGSLSSIGASPVANGVTAPCWVEISHNGQFLFAVNTGSGQISSYAIAPNGSLSLLGNTPVGNTSGVGAVDARLSNDGRTLYVDESRVGTVGAFAVNGGTLTELPSSPVSLPAGATPAGIVTTGF